MAEANEGTDDVHDGDEDADAQQMEEGNDYPLLLLTTSALQILTEAVLANEGTDDAHEDEADAEDGI